MAYTSFLPLGSTPPEFSPPSNQASALKDPVHVKCVVDGPLWSSRISCGCLGRELLKATHPRIFPEDCPPPPEDLRDELAFSRIRVAKGPGLCCLGRDRRAVQFGVGARNPGVGVSCPLGGHDLEPGPRWSVFSPDCELWAAGACLFCGPASSPQHPAGARPTVDAARVCVQWTGKELDAPLSPCLPFSPQRREDLGLR